MCGGGGRILTEAHGPGSSPLLIENTLRTEMLVWT